MIATRQAVPMLDFGRQYAAIGGELMEAIASVCQSQRFILGPEVGSFERAAALACGVAYATGCASGTDALWLALAARGIGGSNQVSVEGSREAVITSPFSFFASASAIVRAGARPVFADIDPKTYNISADSVKEIFEEYRGRGWNVRALLAVDLFGQCGDWDAYGALKGTDPELFLVEDAAQAFGARWRGVPAGALGDAGCFSFYPTKNLSAMGDAGLMTTHSPELDEHARMLRAHGMRKRYFHEEIGWNSRLDTIQAAVLEVKLKYVDGWNEQRRVLARRYDELFVSAGMVGNSVEDGVALPFTDARAEHVFHQYVVRAPRRDELRSFLAERSIGTEVYYPLPLHLQTAFSELGYRPGAFPEAERAAEQVLALPMYPELRGDEQEIVVEAIREFYG